jgi:hypothetical protein
MQSITDELKRLNEKMDKNNNQMMLINQEFIDIRRILLYFMVCVI